MTRRGRYNLDPTSKGFGYGVDGAMTRFVRVPDRLPFERAPGSKKEVAGRDTLQPRAHRSKSTGLSGSAMISPTLVEGVQAR
jgi:hypothetical protein